MNTDLYDAGGVGGSIYGDKFDNHPEIKEEIKLVKASEWIKSNIRKDDIVFMKINVEGSECDIIDELIDTGCIYDMYCVKVDFDVRKIPGMQYRQWETRKKLRRKKIFNVVFAEDFKTTGDFHGDINFWLTQFGVFENMGIEALRVKYRQNFKKFSSRRSGNKRFKEFCTNHFSGNYFYAGARIFYRWGKKMIKK